MSHYDYTLLYLKRKPWGSSVTRWRHRDMSAFGITPITFGTWMTITIHRRGVFEAAEVAAFLHNRKAWAHNNASRRELDWMRKEGLL